MTTNKDKGLLGENIAVEFLHKNRYTIVERNFKNKLGEIDIIAKDRGGVIAFIEVKTRHTLNFDRPEYSVTEFKKRQIAKTAVAYLKKSGLLNSDARFDVVAILLNDNNEITDIELIKDAFELPAQYRY